MKIRVIILDIIDNFVKQSEYNITLHLGSKEKNELSLQISFLQKLNYFNFDQDQLQFLLLLIDKKALFYHLSKLCSFIFLI